MYDVIVSGAGPAGALTAYRCAKDGLSVLLLEKGARGRGKCCAGGLLQRALREMGFPLPDGLVQKEIKGFSFVAEGREFEFSTSQRVGLTVRRNDLDDFLVQKASAEGAEVLESTRAESAIEKAGEVEVNTSQGIKNAKHLVIAEGASSRIADTLLGEHPASWAVMGGAWELLVERPPGQSIDIHLLSLGKRAVKHAPSFPLTGAVFPLRNSVIVSLVGSGVSSKALQDGFESIRKEVNKKYGDASFKGKPCFHPLPIIPRWRLHSARSLVVGDAAGLVSPFSGEGLTSAIISAKLASMVLLGSHDKRWKGDLRRYDTLCRQEIFTRLRAACLIGPLAHWYVGTFGFERTMRNLRSQDKLVRSCIEFASGEGRIIDLAREAFPSIPALLRHPPGED